MVKCSNTLSNRGLDYLNSWVLAGCIAAGRRKCVSAPAAAGRHRRGLLLASHHRIRDRNTKYPAKFKHTRKIATPYNKRLLWRVPNALIKRPQCFAKRANGFDKILILVNFPYSKRMMMHKLCKC